jgi:hypothetical protein
MCLISRHTRLIGSYLRCLAGACHGASWRFCEFPCRSIANVAVASWRVKSSTANLGVTGYRRRRRLGARLMESGPVGRDRAGGARPATRLDGYVSGRRRRRQCQGRTGAALLMVITASPESSVRVCSFHSAMLSSQNLASLPGKLAWAPLRLQCGCLDVPAGARLPGELAWAPLRPLAGMVSDPRAGAFPRRTRLGSIAATPTRCAAGPPASSPRRTRLGSIAATPSSPLMRRRFGCLPSEVAWAPLWLPGWPPGTNAGCCLPGELAWASLRPHVPIDQVLIETGSPR